MAVLMREAIGGSLRRMRTARRRTLRDVSRRARVSLGYLSEVERGRKEPSSELLAAICDALDVALSDLLSEAAVALDAAAAAEAAAARPQRLVGLRHLDLRVAGSDAATGPRLRRPASAPIAPMAQSPVQPTGRAVRAAAWRPPSRAACITRSAVGQAVARDSGLPRRRDRDDPRYRRSSVEAGPLRCHDGDSAPASWSDGAAGGERADGPTTDHRRDTWCRTRR